MLPRSQLNRAPNGAQRDTWRPLLSTLHPYGISEPKRFADELKSIFKSDPGYFTSFDEISMVIMNPFVPLYSNAFGPTR